MAIPFLIAIDLNKNELKNAVIQNLASDPSSPVEGQIYYNTTDHTIRWRDAGAWRVIGYVGATTPVAAQIAGSGAAGSSFEVARADHSHAGVAVATAGVNGFMPGTDKTKLDAATASPTVSTIVLRDASGRAQFVDPSAAQDAATKAYVDTVAQGLDAKPSVVAATTGNITLSGAQTIDGIALIAGDRCLVKSQSAPAENGIYLVAAGSWTRALDMDAWAEVPSAYCFVEQGTANADTGWVCTANAGGTLNTTAITWTQFNGAGSIVGGAGLTLTGTTLAVGAGTGITVNADDVAIDTTVVVRKYATDVGDGVATQIDVTHSLGTRDVTAEVYRVASPYERVHCDIEHLSTSAVRLRFATAPASAEFRCVVHG